MCVYLLRYDRLDVDIMSLDNFNHFKFIVAVIFAISLNTNSYSKRLPKSKTFFTMHWPVLLLTKKDSMNIH